MNEAVLPELLLLGVSLLAGVLCLLGYDLLCLLRILSGIPVWLEKLTDVVYWCAAAIRVFIMIHDYNSGVLRAYSLLAILGGMLGYRAVMRGRLCAMGGKIKKELQKKRKQGKIKRRNKKQRKSEDSGDEDRDEQKA
ncbi:MAG: spore cortex biosynthesis protein YabQ [Lachnospiraceae bacterium]|nr:spore cortex biosynthesis protein YabQ [Lachnospiraceae bacterium]